MKLSKTMSLATVGLSLLFAGSAIAETFTVVSRSNSLPKGFEKDVRGAGGSIVQSVPEIGVASVRFDNPEQVQGLSGLRGIQGIYPEFEFELPATGPGDQVNGHGPIPYAGGTSLDGTLWGIADVRAPEAWAEGVDGTGARVAVLDAGIDHDHPDLAPNLNSGLSASFQPCPGFAIPNCVGGFEDWRIRSGFYFNHGTHTAGTIGATNDGEGVTGVAPNAEIVAVKVCTEYANSCNGTAILNGIVYAGNIGADVANMSLGGLRVKGNDWWFEACMGAGFSRTECAKAARFFVTQQDDYIQGAIIVFERAFRYANQAGTAMVVSAGNSAMDLDHNVDIWAAFADFPGTIGVSALGPVGWCSSDLAPTDTLAYYSNWGRSAIDVSAPGGNFLGAFIPLTDECTIDGITRVEWAFDGVMSTISEGWGWAQGTSMAAPHVTGIAALIVSELGSMPPKQLEHEIKARAVDLGDVGTDPIHGKGRVSSGY